MADNVQTDDVKDKLEKTNEPETYREALSKDVNLKERHVIAEAPADEAKKSEDDLEKMEVEEESNVIEAEEESHADKVEAVVSIEENAAKPVDEDRSNTVEDVNMEHKESDSVEKVADKDVQDIENKTQNVDKPVDEERSVTVEDVNMEHKESDSVDKTADEDGQDIENKTQNVDKPVDEDRSIIVEDVNMEHTENYDVEKLADKDAQDIENKTENVDKPSDEDRSNIVEDVNMEHEENDDVEKLPDVDAQDIENKTGNVDKLVDEDRSNIVDVNMEHKEDNDIEKLVDKGAQDIENKAENVDKPVDEDGSNTVEDVNMEHKENDDVEKLPDKDAQGNENKTENVDKPVDEDRSNTVEDVNMEHEEDNSVEKVADKDPQDSENKTQLLDKLVEDRTNTVEEINMEHVEKVADTEAQNIEITPQTDIPTEDVDMDKPTEERPGPSKPAKEVSKEGGETSIVEDVHMEDVNKENTKEKEPAAVLDKQPDISIVEKKLAPDSGNGLNEKAGIDNEKVGKASKDTPTDCAEADTPRKANQIEKTVSVDVVDTAHKKDDNKKKDNTEKDADKNKSTVEQRKYKGKSRPRSTVTYKTYSNYEDLAVPSTSKASDPILIIRDTNKSKKAHQTSNLTDENSIFVQINNDPEKSSNTVDPATIEIDPIGSSEWTQNTEPTDTTFISELDAADECIIPDANKEESSTLPSSQESTSTLASTPATSSSADTDSMRLSEKYLVSVANSEEASICMICHKKRVCKYNCSKDNVKTTLCSEECLTKLKELYTENVIVRKLRVKNFSTDLQGSVDDSTILVPSLIISANIKCKTCDMLIPDVSNSLSWEAFDFCDEFCLTRHQKMIGSYCANCRIEVKDNFLGKYCVRFGYSVRQFCSSTCLEQYKRISKVCSFCQDDISGNPGGFLTSIADKGTAKDFCSPNCMHKYNEISKHLRGARSAAECCVCHKNTTIEMEFEYRNKKNIFCSQPCFVAFKYVNEVSPLKCDMCCKYYVTLPLAENYLIRYDGVLRRFCERTCQNIYITTNRKIVSCCWCKVKKYNFDMIQKYTSDNTVIIICSLTCLNFYNASVNATKSKRKRCDYCHKICKGQYHITLADDSMRNFCSYPCVQDYQTKYIIAPARYVEQPAPIRSTASNMRITRKSSIAHRKQIIPDVPGPLPIITSVRSLAPGANQTVTTRSLRSRSSAPTIATVTTLQESTAPSIKRVILVRPPDLPEQRNMSTSVKPITGEASAQFKPIMVDKAVQTEDLKDSLVLLPVPVPIYIPAPMKAFSLPYPVPVPFPLPIPIPMFIPVTKKTASVLLKRKKKIEIKTDPYEADLLMMAEIVAGEVEKKEQPDSEGESDGDHAAEPFSPEHQEGHFGDDMFHMAMHMASDFGEPAVDLEGALTASTITATPGSGGSDQVEDVVPIQPPVVKRSQFRGRRRGRPPRHSGRRRGGRRRLMVQPDSALPAEEERQRPPEPAEKPDANMCLKYTFGVNAWKQWVTTKNAELEKTSKRAKLIKSDLLQLTSDELNYSLCLFVKEVRKPNGSEYAPDTIYYLCLGIQQYLYENGRVDNIFCDSYYESFTDCLDEICKKFSSLYNDSQYIVTRVEEEHLWESKQLGAHSPHVLLTTLMFFNTKHFNLTNVDEHMQLSFSHIMKHWKRVPTQPGQPRNAPSSRNILLRFYPPQSAVESNNRKKKVYEQQENEGNPLRCPVKLYEFYLSKCPESVKTRNDVFYLLPERSCVPDSPVWYSTMALGRDALEKMLHRVKMVKEINVALLAS